MKYPELTAPYSIGVTPVSNGIYSEAEQMFEQTFKRMEERGFILKINEDSWGQQIARAASSEVRAQGLMEMINDEEVDIIMPPWGGHLSIEVLEKLDFDRLPSKWITGYSDISPIALAMTLNKGIATAHMANIVDLRGKAMDDVTARWLEVLSTKPGETVIQVSSEMYQEEWDHEHPTDIVFKLSELTEWKALDAAGQKVRGMHIEGRLLGGCIDCFRHLIGTPYGDVQHFRRQYTEMEPVIWFIDDSELDSVELKRSLIQMKYAGWFDDCAGLLFGRVGKPLEKEGYTYEMVYAEMAVELNVPVIYDMDFGHKPPQVTLITGSYGMIETNDGKGEVRQTFI